MSRLVAVDGAEGVGKSSVCATLAAIDGGVFAHDFTELPLGRFLEEQVVENPHVFMHSRLAQSLMFLADHVARIDGLRRGPHDVAWLERGSLSKLVYQAEVLGHEIGRASAYRLLEPLVDAMPQPDVVVLLVAEVDVLVARIVGRGETADEERRTFIATAQEEMIERVPPTAVIVDTTHLTLASTVDAVRAGLAERGRSGE